MPEQIDPRHPRRFSWKWYHFYFLLALIDVMVIIATLFTNHRTIESFDAALADVVTTHERQSWIDDYRFAIIQLNAPGNDIFQSRDLPGEQARFATALSNYKKLLPLRRGNGDATDRATRHVEEMTQAAETVFAYFEEMLDDAVPESRKSLLLSAATATMAMMDRALANALVDLAGESRSALVHEKMVLDRHQVALAHRTGIERIFLGVVVFILVCAFLYGRQLQRTHEELERERNRAASERQSRLASIGEVCFACAHGIRNPLTAIINSAQLIMQHPTLDDEPRARVQNLMDSAWFLNDCVSRLLTFAHSPKLDIEDVVPENVLERALSTLSDRIDKRGIHVTRSYGSGDLVIRADVTLLTQAVVELINNAIDHTAEGGHISLVTTRDSGKDGWVELGVVDDGPGIPDEVRRRACELFFTMRAGGTGIGLATVKRAADLHEGNVLLGDAQPRGADVRIRLPGTLVA